jgi:hypothetical protein
VSTHVVIAGPGRAGTTLLVRLFDALGFDAGVERLEYSEAAHAGLEADLLDPVAPYVVKHPGLTDKLPGLLDSGQVDARSIDWLVVPLRNLEESAASRIKIAAERRDFHAPGGMFGTKSPRWQAAWLAEATYRLFQAAARHELPTIVLEYPRFARDAQYAYRRLEPMLGGRSAEEFETAWNTVVDPSLVRERVEDVPRFAVLKIRYARIRDWTRAKVEATKRRLP